MIVIGTSGSTKCDWRLVKEGEIHRSFSGPGINPFVHSEKDIIRNIKNSDHFEEYEKEIKVVYLYSAGCHTKKLKLVVQEALITIFPRAYHYVNHDIVAAALATYDGSPAITAILGTGSNSCYFDGEAVRHEVPALDYVLGNEGAGTSYGKRLLKNYLYKKLPEDLSNSFRDSYNLEASEVLDKIYFQPHVNVYLASFMAFVEKHKDHPYIINMLKEGIDNFIKYFILCYSGTDKLKCHFVGSIAWNYEDILRERAQEFQLNIGKIIKEPIDGLVNYLIKKHY